ncbi:mitochondrial poly(A) polymerase isoform X2 [Megalopta genalis]|uniref:mitochondrial poly(A) polymerase isoform X2 n=1 Tax=Megalopta genalis TaxID=115081 RepID=UPI003FD22436
MALVYRITTNLYTLLNSNYWKYSVMVTRLKSRKHSFRKPETKDNHSSEMEKNFSEIHKFRRSQARRSVLLQLKEFKQIGQCQQFLESFGKLESIFHYTTKLENPNMILAEYCTTDSVNNILRQATYKDITEYIAIPTKILQYHEIDLSNVNNNITFQKYSHHYPTWASTRANLLHPKHISDQMLLLYDTLKLTDIDIRLRYYTVNQLNFVLCKLFPTISVLPFGSSVSGFGEMGCDLDLVCTFSHNSKIRKDHDSKLIFSSKPFCLVERFDQREFLKQLSVLLDKFIPGVSNVQCVLQARVPIVKFRFGPTSMQCDLSTNNLSGFYMSQMFYTLANIDCRIRPLIFTIRKWARSHGVTSNIPGSKITNFSLMLLIVHYLQHINMVPPLRKILLSSQMSIWNCNTKNVKKMEKLLYGFFEYYATFDFHMHAICVLDGYVKQKPDATPLYIHNPLDNLIDEPSSKDAKKEHHEIRMRKLDENKPEILEKILKDDAAEAIKLDQTDKMQEIIK